MGSGSPREGAAGPVEGPAPTEPSTRYRSGPGKLRLPETGHGYWPTGVPWFMLDLHRTRPVARHVRLKMPWPRCLPLAALLLTGLTWAMGGPPNAARVETIAGWLAPQPAGVGPPIPNREAWAPLTQQPQWQRLIREAEGLVREGIPDQPDELYLDYSRTGNRERWQRVAFARRARVSTLVLAEAVENRGRFVGPLEETLRALCEERTWVYPAHDASLRNFRGEVVEMDLGSTALSWDLAAAVWLMGPKLSPQTRDRVWENLHRRTLRPFRDMVEGRQREAFWLRATHNWNAVCLAGTLGTALSTIESARERAWFVAVAEERIRSFLAGFTADGYCSEGLGYWNYGFGHFVWLAEMLRLATDGRLDLLADPAAFMPALFPWRAEILNGVYPSLSDCNPGTKPDARVVQVLSERFRLSPPGGVAAGGNQPGRALAITVLSTFLPRPLPPVPAHPGASRLDPLRTWFDEAGVLVGRPAAGQPAFAVCLKGGHNGEHHNHNDVGSFSLVVGDVMVLCDPGAEVYTARTFSPRRYESRVLSSYGHSVPRVDGQLQRTGPSARARVLRAAFDPGADQLVLDLRSAYEVAGLEKLEREFVYRRGARPTLTIADRMESVRPLRFETALITWSSWQLQDHHLQIGEGTASVRVEIHTAGLPWNARAEVLEEEVRTAQRPRRIAVELAEPVQRCEVRMIIRPIQSGAQN